MSEVLSIRPYARLLTMLGDQLIKDEVIAIIELIKNAYDADAERVTVRFCNFGSDYSCNDKSYIVIEDDGNGMDEDILKKSWMNPATPDKLKRKRIKRTTDKGRIMQGEKGIGRFAIFKLGRRISIITRRQAQYRGRFVEKPESDNEYVLTYDFSKYDNDFLSYNDKDGDYYLDDLNAVFDIRKAKTIVEVRNNGLDSTKPYGTKIIISNLNGKWNKKKIDKVFNNIQKMQPIFIEEFQRDFEVRITVNDADYSSNDVGKEEILSILEDKSVFIVEGSFNNGMRMIEYELNNHTSIIKNSFKLSDPEMLGIKPLKKFFESIEDREIECGSFKYKFYILDLNIKSTDRNTRFYLDQNEKDLVKEHRVYLYRDGIRVMPYGDVEDDWLSLDVIRGTEKSGAILGNDQIVGYISITQKENPNLKDKTNREGLIEEGYAREDLVSICQLILRYLRTTNYAQYLVDKKRKKAFDEAILNKPISLIENARETQIGRRVVEAILKDKSEDKNDGEQIINVFLDDFEKAYQKEIDVLESRISTSENLAAIGLSAETAYHDARVLLRQINSSLKALLDKYNKQYEELMYRECVIKELEPIKNQTDTVSKLMANVQRLFPSTKSRKKVLNINKLITQVRDLYGESLRKAGIQCKLVCAGRISTSLNVECTDAVLFQVFINLFDNALYWLKLVKDQRSIIVTINAEERTVIFSDSGPGVSEDDASYIFEPFYSKKGEDGKGLGLYIARQLLERYNYSIDLLTEGRPLRGACFIMHFCEPEE